MLTRLSQRFIFFAAVLSLSLRFTGAFSQEINFSHLTINDGLSQNTVYFIHQDKMGFVWIGTEDGLNRFDGYEFKVYRHLATNKNSIRSNQVNSIFENNNGDLWVATSTGLDLLSRKSDAFSHIDLKLPPGSSTFLTYVKGDYSGNLWLGTYDGVKRYRIKSGQVTSFTGSSHDGSGRSKRSYTIFAEKNGVVWAGIGSEIMRIQSGSDQVLPPLDALKQLPEWGKSTVRAIKLDSRGNAWASTESSGLFYIPKDGGPATSYTTENSTIVSNTIRDIFIRNDDEIWLGTRDGLSILRIRDRSFSNYVYDRYDPASLNHNSVRCFMLDNAGSIWLGTFSGGINIYQHPGEKFALIKEKMGSFNGLNHRVVSSVTQTSADDIWIGTEGGGLNYFNRATGKFSYFLNGSVSNRNPQNIIKALAPDAKHNLWVGTYDGLSYFDAAKGSFKNYKLPDNGLSFNNQLVYSMFAESSGVWVGTNGGGLNFVTPSGSAKSFIHDKNDGNSVSSNNITAIIPQGKNLLWIGTENGLNRYDRNRNAFDSYVENEGKTGTLSSGSVLSLLLDSKNRLWIGTKGGGLNRMEASGKFSLIDTRMGLANDVIHAIIEDRSGNIWVSTNAGLSRITLRSNRSFPSSKDIRIENFTIADGLQSNQFSAAALKASGNQLFFGGIAGLNYFNPEKIVLNRLKPKVVITDLLVRSVSVSSKNLEEPLKQPIDQTDHFTLSYDEAFITLKFAALNFVNPSKNKYAYKLVGLRNDDDWHFVGNQRFATYTNLPAGSYTFKVKAANNDGIWSGSETSIRVTVLPPLWKTWWAYALYASAVSFLLYLFYYYSVKTARLKSELDLEHVTREKELELTQRKMSFFTNISHEIKTPLTLILAPLEKLLGMNEGNNKIQNQLMLMQRNGDQLLKLINQLLDFRKFETGGMQLQAAEGNMVRFVREVVFAFKAYASSKKVDLTVDAPKSSVRVWFDRDKFEKILYNLMSNSLKFTRPGGKITLHVSTDHSEPGFSDSYALIRVSDTGKGIKPEFIDHVFDQFNENIDKGGNASGSGIGLSFTRSLVELHHGKITALSTPEEKGHAGFTSFTIRIPLGNAHLGKQEMIPDYKDTENISAYQQENETERYAESMARPEWTLPDSEPITIQAPDKHMDALIQEISSERQIMLVVEDNPDVLDFISSHFKDEFEVHTAENGQEGWEKAGLVLPDIIISDVMMPGLSGTELCTKVKLDSKTSHIPVILLTARTPLIFKIEGLETGADDYITKPFSLALLGARVWNLLESRKKLRERFSKEVMLQPANIAITSPDEKFLEKIMAFIEANLSEPTLSVEELGREVSMSRVTLYRKIKALTNQTAIEFIRSIRLKRAAQLLEQNKFNVSEVSYFVGFSDVDYFRRCFKEQFGYTPREYAHSLTDPPK